MDRDYSDKNIQYMVMRIEQENENQDGELIQYFDLENAVELIRWIKQLRDERNSLVEIAKTLTLLVK